MTFVSKLALAAVLSLGAVSVGAAPAAAQKKDDKGAQAGAPQLKVSPEFRKVAAAAETSVKAKDWAAAEPNIMVAVATVPPITTAQSFVNSKHRSSGGFPSTQ